MKKLILVVALMSASAQAREVSTLVYNQSKDAIVVGNHLNVTRPIASLTKLMTAMVSLDHDLDLKRKIKTNGSNTVPPGEYSREELMTAMLVRSDNGAAEAIANDYPGGRKAFILAMNNKAQSIGMTATKFTDPTGLSSGNTSNAGSVGIMLKNAVDYDFIKNNSTRKKIYIERRKYTLVLENTNKMLLYDFNEVLLSKTGFTNPAGWNVAMVLEKDNQRFSVVVLGAKSPDQRYTITKKLIDNYFRELALEKDNEIMYNSDRSLYQKFMDWFEAK